MERSKFKLLKALLNTALLNFLVGVLLIVAGSTKFDARISQIVTLL